MISLRLSPASAARRFGRSFAAALALGLVGLAPITAEARPVFADWLRSYAAQNDTSGTPAPRPIIDRPLCHNGSDTTSNFLARPFTDALRAESDYVELTQRSREIFMAAMTAMDENKVDSDCDGYPDLDEIRANIDPNDASKIPPGDPPQAPCTKPIDSEPQPPPAPPTGDDDDDDDDDDQSGSNSDAPAKAPAAGSCAVSSTGRPLDLSAFSLAALVALPLTRRALRPRASRQPSKR
jgi:hypothetical protein